MQPPHNQQIKVDLATDVNSTISIPSDEKKLASKVL